MVEIATRLTRTTTLEDFMQPQMAHANDAIEAGDARSPRLQTPTPTPLLPGHSAAGGE